ncbi:MAG: LysR family transcriptional regulator [Pseudomonadota bacterium]
MAPQSSRKDLSLKWLELFQICAQQGSLQAAARETGLSVSTVSHHLRNLEDHLGVALFNHSRRPMVLTPKGRVFLRNIDDALYAIRRAKAEASAGGLTEARELRIGTIEDFDSDIVPELAVFLSRSMPRCNFSFHTDSSHALFAMLRDRQLDLGITTIPTERLRDVVDRPLLRDPFVVVVPAGARAPVSDIVAGQTDLPLLRFSGALIIARQIESQLRRLGSPPPPRFESSNHRTLMAMVAAGAGWAISTPMLYAHAQRFHDDVTMHPFPGKQFSRALTILATPDCARSVVDVVDGRFRKLVSDHAIKPMHARIPWLKDMFMLVDDA